VTTYAVFRITSSDVGGDVPLIVEIESGGSSLLVVHEW